MYTLTVHTYTERKKMSGYYIWIYYMQLIYYKNLKKCLADYLKRADGPEGN